VGQRFAFEQPHKGFFTISLLITSGNFLCQFLHAGAIKMFYGRQVKCRQNSPVDRDKMRRELDCDRFASRERKLLLDLGKVAMLGDAVGPDTLVAFDEKVIELCFASGATDAT